ncbi:MAG: ABC transporter ATP-binding protein [Acidimicrobiia bacterium]
MGILELDSVEKRFGGLPAVGGVTLGVDEGEILAIVGPNGAGKSTLLKIVVGLETPTSGAIRLGGADITGLVPHRIRQLGIAMVLQTPRVFPTMTVLENVALGAMFGGSEGLVYEAEATRRSRQALDVVGRADRATDAVGSLNLHEQRFLGLARAIAGRPRVLLADEVMAGLNDTELQASIEIVRTVREELGVTVVWIEHVMKAVMNLAERVVVLNFGMVLADGAPGDVMRDPAVVNAYLGQDAVADA